MKCFPEYQGDHEKASHGHHNNSGCFLSGTKCHHQPDCHQEHRPAEYYIIDEIGKKSRIPDHQEKSGKDHNDTDKYSVVDVMTVWLHLGAAFVKLAAVVPEVIHCFHFVADYKVIIVFDFL